MKILYFTADWCTPCKEMRPRFEKLAGEMGIMYSRVDMSDMPFPSESSDYRVDSVPTLIAIDDAGNEISRHVGYGGARRLKAWLIGLMKD